MNFKFLKSNIYWRTYHGKDVLVEDLTLNHINNILLCLNNLGERKIPENYLGKSHDEWIKIMNEQLTKILS
jgi:hypothetical protein